MLGKFVKNSTTTDGITKFSVMEAASFEHAVNFLRKSRMQDAEALMHSLGLDGEEG
ncbi:hypothetical protein [Comamonas thiooxydans]|uniref:hypothetical protein n=1 Tax=Comamonas thiooxydans TaxID=363952 RepID=UPI0015573FEE|nr:hypothetical protein [Comamonas thiooxydans]